VFVFTVSSPSPRLRAIAQALFVTFLWSTSWVLIKIGLRDLPPLPFAGLRYTLAWLCLLPFAFQRLRARPSERAALRALSPAAVGRLAVLGLLLYTVAQGAQFVALRHLPAVTVNLMLNFTTVVVALLGLPLLGERLTPGQWGGMLLALAGALVVVYPASVASGPARG
jgi:drug/metabolite transporter (DMT)-like permease